MSITRMRLDQIKNMIDEDHPLGAGDFDVSIVEELWKEADEHWACFHSEAVCETRIQELEKELSGKNTFIRSIENVLDTNPTYEYELEDAMVSIGDAYRSYKKSGV